MSSKMSFNELPMIFSFILSVYNQLGILKDASLVSPKYMVLEIIRITNTLQKMIPALLKMRFLPYLLQ